MHPSWITIYVKLKFYQILPVTVAHHVIILTIFFYCDKYTDNREILFNSHNRLPSNINIDVNLLAKGSDFLTYQENTTIFKHDFKYIKDSQKTYNCLNDLKNQHTSPKVFILLSFLSYIVSTYVFVYNHSVFIYLYAYYIHIISSHCAC
jgi:hypothetical protein